MRCKNCPAYWENVFMGVVEDWGCLCEYDNGDSCFIEFKNGDCGCYRKLKTIEQILNNKSYEKDIDLLKLKRSLENEER